MLLWDLFATLGILVVFSAILLGFFKRRKWGILLLILAYLFLAMWAGSVWAGLVGPLRFGMFWLPILMAGLALALIFSARRLIKNARARAGGEGAPFPNAVLTLIGLIAMLILTAGVLARYLYGSW
jgi:hypothetical protein